MKSDREYKKGLWKSEEDRALIEYITVHGKGKWNRIATETGLKRCGKSCRLRWVNYLSPGVKRGDFTEEEDDLIIRLHNLLGNRWSLIAGRVPGRTDNQVKNHWNTHLSKRSGMKKMNNNDIKGVRNSEGISEMDYSSIDISELPNTSNVVGEADHQFIKSSQLSASRDLGDNNINNNNRIGNNNCNHDCGSSFWFSSAEDFMNPISSFDLVESLEEHSLDIVWDIGLY